MVTLAPPPLLSEIMPTHDKDRGDISEKNIGQQPGLVCLDSMQRPIKKHIQELKKHTFCQCAPYSVAYRIIVNKTKEKLVSRRK